MARTLILQPRSRDRDGLCDLERILKLLHLQTGGAKQSGTANKWQVHCPILSPYSWQTWLIIPGLT